jgi:hypothetical protein
MALTTVTAGESSLPGLLKNPKVILPVILLLAGGAIFLMARGGEKPVVVAKREIPVCFPTGVSNYTQGSKPLVKLGKTDAMAVERNESTTVLLIAMSKCTTLFCPGKGLADYKTKLERYITQRVNLVKKFDTEFGDDGVTYAHQLFQTRDDDLIVGDLRQRVEAKNIAMDYVQANPPMEILLLKKPEEFVPCR